MNPASITTALETAMTRLDKLFVTPKELRKRLPKSVCAQLRLEGVDDDARLLKALRPHLGDTLTILGEGRRRYVGYDLPLDFIVMEHLRAKVAAKPGQTARALFSAGQGWPCNKRRFMMLINQLLRDGHLRAGMNHDYQLTLLALEPPETVETASSGSRKGRDETQVAEKSPAFHAEADVAALRVAYDNLAVMTDFVPIHRLRQRLGWSRQRFDALLDEMSRAGRIELHSGEPGRLSATDRRDILELNGQSYATLRWREDDE